jgi:hypothetical protein
MLTSLSVLLREASRLLMPAIPASRQFRPWPKRGSGFGLTAGAGVEADEIDVFPTPLLWPA